MKRLTAGILLLMTGCMEAGDRWKRDFEGRKATAHVQSRKNPEQQIILSCQKGIGSWSLAIDFASPLNLPKGKPTKVQVAVRSGSKTDAFQLSFFPSGDTSLEIGRIEDLRYLTRNIRDGASIQFRTAEGHTAQFTLNGFKSIHRILTNRRNCGKMTSP